jgi:hypothetical protein
MRQIRIAKYEQHLSQCVTETLKQMTELKQLRELVHLAEAAKALHRPKGLVPTPAADLPLIPNLDCEILDTLSRFQLLDQPARPLATTGPSL